MPTTREEKAARKLSETVGDITLDLDMVSFYLGRYEPLIIQDRLSKVIYRAETERQLQDEQYRFDTIPEEM